MHYHVPGNSAKRQSQGTLLDAVRSSTQSHGQQQQQENPSCLRRRWPRPRIAIPSSGRRQPEEVSKAKALLRAGKVFKPECVQFCNRIHLLELQAGKGDMDEEKARKIKRTLLVELARSGRKSAAHERPRRHTMARTMRRRFATRRPSVQT